MKSTNNLYILLHFEKSIGIKDNIPNDITTIAAVYKCNKNKIVNTNPNIEPIIRSSNSKLKSPKFLFILCSVIYNQIPPLLKYYLNHCNVLY